MIFKLIIVIPNEIKEYARPFLFLIILKVLLYFIIDMVYFLIQSKFEFVKIPNYVICWICLFSYAININN